MTSVFIPEALSDLTLTIYSGLGLALKLVTLSGWFLIDTTEMLYNNFIHKSTVLAVSHVTSTHA